VLSGSSRISWIVEDKNRKNMHGNIRSLTRWNLEKTLGYLSVHCSGSEVWKNKHQMVTLSDSGLNESASVHFLESPFEIAA